MGNTAVNNQTRERKKKIKNILKQQRPKLSKIKKNPNNNKQQQQKAQTKELFCISQIQYISEDCL